MTGSATLRDFPTGWGVQPWATGSVAKLQKSARPYAVLKKNDYLEYSAD